MEDIYNENLDSLKPDEQDGELPTDPELTGEEGSEEPLSEEQVLEKLEELKATKVTNAKLYARAKKAEEALKGRKDSTNETNKDSDPWKEKIEFVLKHKDFDEDQIDILSSFAKGKGVSLEDAFKDKLVKKVIEADQTDKRIANATPEGKSKSSQFKDLQQQINEATDRDSHKELWKTLSQGNPRGVESE